MSVRKNTKQLSVTDIRKAVTKLRQTNLEVHRGSAYTMIFNACIKTDYSMIDGQTDTYEYYGDF